MSSNPAVGLAHGTYILSLDKTIVGTAETKTFLGQFTYTWDFVRKEGEASLDTINGTNIGITLHPEGLSDKLYFMSDMQPTEYLLGDGGTIIVYRVILQLIDGTGAASVMEGKDGSTIVATENWSENDSATSQLAGKGFGGAKVSVVALAV